MDEKVRRILTEGGVTLHLRSGKQWNLSRLLVLLESWLGFTDAIVGGEHDDMVMMEEAGPFDATFYREIEDFLIEVWKPDEVPQHKFFGLGNHDSDDDYEKNNNNGIDEETTVSLYKSILSVRVTRLLRYWMELYVASGQVDDEKGLDMQRNTFSFQFLNQCSFHVNTANASNTEKRFKFFPIIQALYQYIEQLPFLQSQIYLYSQCIARGNHNSKNFNRPGIGLANPQSRLAQLQLGQRVRAKLEKEFMNHVNDVEYIVGEWYEMGTVEIRRQCRAQLGSIWSTFEVRTSGVGYANGSSSIRAGVGSENTSSSGIDLTLRVLHRILMGLTKYTTGEHQNSSLCKSYEQLLFQHLIPLHRPNSMVLWRDQTSLLDLYHEPLVKCIAILIKHKPEWTGRVVEGLLGSDIWNNGAGNTPKLVLLLHEIDIYIGCLPGTPDEIKGTELGDSFSTLLQTLGFCMASENSRLAQRALPYVKNKKFVRLMEANIGSSLEILLPFLLRKEPSWNPTVRKMTYNVLVVLRDFDPERFVEVGNRCLVNERQKNKKEKPASLTAVDSKLKKSVAITNSSNNTSLLPTDYTIKSAMGTWTPPAQSDERRGMVTTMPPPKSRSSNPPLSVTGVAPWGMSSQGSRSNPPLAVTGVAPWAMKPAQGIRKTSSRRKNAPLQTIGKGVAPWSTKNHRNLHTESPIKTEESQPGRDTFSENAFCRIQAYMEKIKPPEEEKGISQWSRTQMAETPTLLPNLKFHDLVFGHDLGEGAFGSVRYARLIDRTKTRSHWPEYAVKIISTEKIKAMGYEAPIQRELAVLRVLSHPSIARMISSFRFREGVYIVLEYAKKGDLHTMLRVNGSLGNDSTRFIIGEVTAALSSIHEIGLGYFDLKPENIVITESGHVKLTDFGGCRPVTKAAKKMISESARNVFKELRDGDWKLQDEKIESFDIDDERYNEHNNEFVQDYSLDVDLRIEGTTIYLPPEVVLGSFPTLAADSWALGCVLYQCLTGRPPIFEVDENLAKNRIVSFDINEEQKNGDDFLFEDSKAGKIEASARDLITRLMNRNANERPTMTQVAYHSFFQNDGMDLFALWRQPALDLEVGDAAPPPADAAWARRQLSSIWAPQPQAYDVSSDDSVGPIPFGTGNLSGPISEGEEAPFYFSKSNILPSVRSASQAVPLPPRKKVAEN